MAQVTVRANLSSAQIPLLMEEFGRSVIVRQQDLNYVPSVASKSDLDKDIGIPQIYYAHNVMPTSYGYRSVLFNTQVPSTPVNTFSQVFELLAVSGAKASLAVNTDGTVYVYHSTVGYTWQAISDFYKLVVTEGTNTGDGYVVSASAKQGAGVHTYVATMTSSTGYQVTKDGVVEATGTIGADYVSADTKVTFVINTGSVPYVIGDSFTLTSSLATFNGAITKATISGATYIASEGQGIFEYDFTLNTLVWRMAAGLDPTSVLGITGTNGYLIVYSTDAVLWSSVIDTLDLVPSLLTGAGGGSIEEAKGAIRRCVGLTSGFLIFTASNCVAATYANNIRYPFTFREVPNAGGIADLSLVTDEADSTAVYAYTSYGMQQISTQKATPVLTEITDFLTGRRLDDFDTNTLTFSTLESASALKKRVEFISGRFLVISYGISSFTHSIVYDTALQRFGKLRIPHVASFQYGFLDADDADTPKKQIAMLQADGSIKTVDFSQSQSSDSVLLLGKFQYIRQRLLQLDSVQVESISSASDCAIYDLITLDGKTFEPPILGYDTGNIGAARNYSFRATGSNHSILAIGVFRLNSVLLSFNVHGNR